MERAAETRRIAFELLHTFLGIITPKVNLAYETSSKVSRKVFVVMWPRCAVAFIRRYCDFVVSPFCAFEIERATTNGEVTFETFCIFKTVCEFESESAREVNLYA